MSEQGSSKKLKIWLAIAVFNTAAFAYLGYGLYSASKGRSWYAPGAASDGHHQIVESCKTCHVPFKGVSNQVCLDCHGKELEEADDSHPESKFLDPRNAELIERLDATLCVTCHNEHVPGNTRAFGVTLPDDFCVECHRDIADDRKSHKGMSFDTCASGGCHNYHDNRALYEDFLIKHIDEPPEKAGKLLLKTEASSHPKALSANQQDGGAKADQTLLREWALSAHAQEGVNCSGCHSTKKKNGQIQWKEEPSVSACKSCHEPNYETFIQGKHGMRLAQKLSAPFKPRLPMKQEPVSMTCQSCHQAHAYEARQAATEACIGCHDDEHTKAYKDSPHYLAWIDELTGKGALGTGVSCASCHMPRQEHPSGEGRSFVDHNQNHNLEPNEKMVRSVCLNCHDLEFSLKALADPEQIRGNFASKPDFLLKSLDMARERR